MFFLEIHTIHKLKVASDCIHKDTCFKNGIKLIWNEIK